LEIPAITVLHGGLQLFGESRKRDNYTVRSRDKDCIREVEMTSTKERVQLRGHLSGQGYEADCVVSAIKVTVPGGPFAYAKYSVHRISKALPEGDYQLSLSTGETFPVRHRDGHWLTGGLC
jgi:hypothetical protein